MAELLRISKFCRSIWAIAYHQYTDKLSTSCYPYYTVSQDHE